MDYCGVSLLNLQLKRLLRCPANDLDRHQIPWLVFPEDVGKDVRFSEEIVESVEGNDDILRFETGSFGNGVVAVLTDVFDPEGHLA